MMSDYLQLSDWSSAFVPPPYEWLMLDRKVSPAPSSHEAASHWLDDSGCQSLSAYIPPPPPSSSLYGHPAVTPPPTCLLPSAPGWNPSPSSSDWPLPGSLSWGRGHAPEQRVCVSCGSSSAPLWRRDADGRHLCHTCCIQQQTHNRALLRAKRRASVSQRRDTRCVNCSTENTTLWRRNSAGETVCNACGLYYRLHQVNRPLAMKKEGIRTRNRKVTNQKKRSRRSDQSQTKLSLLAPPTMEAMLHPAAL